MELTEEQRDRLRDWWEPTEGDMCVDQHGTVINYCEDCFYKGYDYFLTLGFNPLLSIGQCIEFLASKKSLFTGIDFKEESGFWDVYTTQLGIMVASGDELIDALWHCVKEVLRDE